MHQPCSVVVLDVGPGDDDRQDQSQRIHQQVALTARDFRIFR
jgi:hypothetical protein